MAEATDPNQHTVEEAKSSSGESDEKVPQDEHDDIKGSESGSSGDATSQTWFDVWAEKTGISKQLIAQMKDEQLDSKESLKRMARFPDGEIREFLPGIKAGQLLFLRDGLNELSGRRTRRASGSMQKFMEEEADSAKRIEKNLVLALKRSGTPNEEEFSDAKEAIECKSYVRFREQSVVSIRMIEAAKYEQFVMDLAQRYKFDESQKLEVESLHYGTKASTTLHDFMYGDDAENKLIVGRFGGEQIRSDDGKGQYVVAYYLTQITFTFDELSTAEIEKGAIEKVQAFLKGTISQGLKEQFQRYYINKTKRLVFERLQDATQEVEST